MGCIKYLVIIGVILMGVGCSNDKEGEMQGYVDVTLRFISSTRSGKLVALSVDKGDRVLEGEELFVLEGEPEAIEKGVGEAKVVEAEARVEDLGKGRRPSEIDEIEGRLERAKADVSIKLLTYERRKQLFLEEATNKESVDLAEAEYKESMGLLNAVEAELETAKLGARVGEIEVARAQLEGAKGELERVEWELGEKRVVSPVKGMVFDTYYEEGEVVPAGKGVLSLLVQEEIWAVFFVPEGLLSRVKLGGEVMVSCDNCEKEFVGKISYISPEAEYTPPVIYSRDRRSKLVYRVEARFREEDSRKLNVGQPVDVRLLESYGR